jgi:hypothetical protein
MNMLGSGKTWILVNTPQKENTMQRRVIDPTEMKTSELAQWDLIALGLLGGTAHLDDVCDKVREILSDRLNTADKRLLYHTEHGQDYAPEAYSGRTWPVWQTKAHYAVGFICTKEGTMERHDNILTLTPAGIRLLGKLACEKELS